VADRRGKTRNLDRLVGIARTRTWTDQTVTIFWTPGQYRAGPLRFGGWWRQNSESRSGPGGSRSRRTSGTGHQLLLDLARSLALRDTEVAEGKASNEHEQTADRNPCYRSHS